MLYRGIKRKVADFINTVVEERFRKISENEEQERNRVSEIICQLQTVEENVRNNNSILLEIQKEISKDNAYDAIDYFSFENYFRGDENLIRERQTIYLPYFQGCNNVMDLGCGRGEFLELLRENGIQAKGVDAYEEFVNYCIRKELNVVSGDAISYLENLSDKVDGIFAGQLVEHLTVKQIIALCKNAFDRLEEGKYLIIETPNPTSLAIYTQSFYVDPSHQKPIHPLTLKYIAETAGFTDVQIYFVEGSGLNESVPQLVGEGLENLEEFNKALQRMGDYLYGAQDYAIIAKR